MACQTMIFDMFQQIGKTKHENVLWHEAKQLAVKNQRVFL
jgi:hypothetical protein